MSDRKGFVWAVRLEKPELHPASRKTCGSGAEDKGLDISRRDGKPWECTGKPRKCAEGHSLGQKLESSQERKRGDQQLQGRGDN